jgi:simple sugar transport system substrate-binding protein
MPENPQEKVSPERWEMSRRRMLRGLGVAAATVPFAGALTEMLTDMPASASPAERKAAGQRVARNSVFESPFASHPAYKFTMVNHVTTNPFFVPTRYGASDAGVLLGCSYTWNGSANSIVSEMVAALDTAISARVNGIATTVITPTGFVEPTNRALAAGIPVVAYNSNVPAQEYPKQAALNRQMSYVGQDLFQAGVNAGNQILKYVKKGDLVAGFIATPGTLNIQPRIDGAASVLKPAGIDFPEIGTGALLSQEATAINAWYLGHKDVKFMYCVDAGSTSEAAAVVEKYNLKGKVLVGGFDFLTTTVGAVEKGYQLWTIDQQPYQQGFMPILELFLYNVSGGLQAPVDIDTGLKFVTKSSIGPYTLKDRYEGSSSAPATLTPPKTIAYS